MSDLKNRVALITGASRGIGRAIGERLGRDGAIVAVNYRDHLNEAEEAARAIERAGGRAKLFQADVSITDEICRLFGEFEIAFGGIDIFVANAGLPFIGVPIVDVEEEDFDRLFALNTKGSFIALQEAARRVRQGGRIIDVSTSTTVFPAAGMGVNSASKARSKLIVEVLAIRLGPRGITVNSVLRGATETAFIKVPPETERERMSQGSPFG